MRAPCLHRQLAVLATSRRELGLLGVRLRTAGKLGGAEALLTTTRPPPARISARVPAPASTHPGSRSAAGASSPPEEEPRSPARRSRSAPLHSRHPLLPEEESRARIVRTCARIGKRLPPRPRSPTCARLQERASPRARQSAHRPAKGPADRPV